MKTYLDSSALVKLYVPEKESQQLSKQVQSQPIAFTQFHELEVKNAIRLKCFRDPSLADLCQKITALIDTDLENGILYRPALNWADIFKLSIQLSVLHTSDIGCRSLDILHVAAAKAGEYKNFITYDERQSRLATAAGLKTSRI
jgi:hypothetical protein